jgi:hypothetical protein
VHKKGSIGRVLIVSVKHRLSGSIPLAPTKKYEQSVFFLYRQIFIIKGVIMKKCEYCEKEHKGEYGSGRFCDYICARGFSTKSKRHEINLKVSKTLSGKEHNGLTKQQRIQLEKQ